MENRKKMAIGVILLVLLAVGGYFLVSGKKS